jgi:hypothetical protein
MLSATGVTHVLASAALLHRLGARAYETPTKPMNRDGTGHAWDGAQSIEIAHHGLFAYRLHREGREFESLTAYQPSRLTRFG